MASDVEASLVKKLFGGPGPRKPTTADRAIRSSRFQGELDKFPISKAGSKDVRAFPLETNYNTAGAYISPASEADLSDQNKIPVQLMKDLYNQNLYERFIQSGGDVIILGKNSIPTGSEFNEDTTTMHELRHRALKQDSFLRNHSLYVKQGGADGKGGYLRREEDIVRVLDAFTDFSPEAQRHSKDYFDTRFGEGTYESIMNDPDLPMQVLKLQRLAESQSGHKSLIHYPKDL